MKKILFILFLSVLSWAATAQTCPPEWLKYTGAGYLYDIQSDYNSRSLGETAFKNELLNAARTNLAKKVQVQVRDNATLDKTAVNGRTSITYSSSTQFSTDINLRLVNSEAKYDASTGEGWAIVYIDRNAALAYYRNEVAQVTGRVDNALTTASNYVAGGFKENARKELKAVLGEFDKLEEPFFWLNFFGMPGWEQSELMTRCSTRQQAVKQMISDLSHGTYIYLRCTADLFGKPYPTLQKELKGRLSGGNYSFADTPAEADWVIDINVTTREYNIVVTGGMTSYFAYADAYLTIDKVATVQRLYEDEISVKGGHTASYAEAGRTAYKDLTGKLAAILKDNIKE